VTTAAGDVRVAVAAAMEQLAWTSVDIMLANSLFID
jgi:hypothetical protein